MRDCKRILWLALVMLSGFTSLQAQSDSEIILKAMEDELDRSMNELVMKDHDRPFFISYRVFDTKGIRLNASLGAISSRDFTPYRSGSIRLIVGDYDFNDESFAQEMEMDFGLAPGTGFMRETMPVEADYAGIRRYFWKATERMYRSAAKSYKGHKAKLKKEEKSIEDVPHLVFSRIPVVKYESPAIKVAWDKEAMEVRAREISAIFLDYPEIENSRVYLSTYHNKEYFISSEGTRIVEEEVSLNLSISASASTAPGFYTPEGLRYEVNSLDELPDNEKLRADIAAFVEKISNKGEQSEFEDSYEGPVLFYDKSAASLFARIFTPSLNATQTATIGEETGYRNRSRELDHKMGKRVTSRDLTISVLPGAETYHGQEMKGAYRYDLEGVKAADSLLLIEKGYLKDLMRGRTVLKGSAGPNGTWLGAGVLSVISHNKKTDDELRQQLIELAEDEGLEYALIVREMPMGGQGVNVYRVSLEDGSETLLVSASLNDLDFNSFRKVGGTSSDRTVHHLPDPFNGSSVSVVSPRILLLEDVEVESFQNYGLKKKKDPLVKSPLAKKE